MKPLNRRKPKALTCVGLVLGFCSLSLIDNRLTAYAASPVQAAAKSAGSAKSQPGLPQRDLLVEIRQVADTQSAGYSVGTRSQTGLMAPQQLQVRNGESAALRMGQSMPMIWTQSAFAQRASLAASDVAGSSESGGVSQALTWLEAGQSIVLRPSWGGGNQAVRVAVEVQTATVAERTGPDLPVRSSSQMATEVSAPMGQWVTLASSGGAPQKGVYGTQSSSEPRRLLQIRVQLP